MQCICSMINFTLVDVYMLQLFCVRPGSHHYTATSHLYIISLVCWMCDSPDQADITVPAVIN
jgi:hypothetical protein